MRRAFSVSGFLLFLFVAALPVNANTLAFNLDFKYEGDNGFGGVAPWLAAKFEDIEGDKIRLTMDSKGLTGNAFAGSWYFNFDPSLASASLFASQLSGPLADVAVGQNSKNAGSATGFDIEFIFKDKFGPNQSAVFDLFLLVNPVDLISSSFNLVNEGGSFFSAAQILGFGSTGSFAWIADAQDTGPGPAPVPEPATMLLLGAGTIGMALFGRKKLKN